MVIILILVKRELLCPWEEECISLPLPPAGFQGGHMAIALALWGKRCDEDLEFEICLGITETRDNITPDITSPSTFPILAA